MYTPDDCLLGWKSQLINLQYKLVFGLNLEFYWTILWKISIRILLLPRNNLLPDDLGMEETKHSPNDCLNTWGKRESGYSG